MTIETGFGNRIPRSLSDIEKETAFKFIKLT